MAGDEDIAAVNKKLGVVIAVLLRIAFKEKGRGALREQVALLGDLGLRPREIAEIIGRTQTYVNKELTMIRREKKKAAG